jgi:hypothetical protein
MSRILRVIVLFLFLGVLPGLRSIAGPPFLTDDPEPVEFHHWEAYIFGIGDHTGGGGYSINGPALELNYGVLPETQLHLILPITSVGGNGLTPATGLGDTEFGVKYRFVQETNGWPQVGTFPMIEIPTGDSSRGLGNGRAWFRLPLWAQKSWGPWTTYGGGGAALNSTPGQRNYPFGGWLLQRDLSKKLTLGGEFYGQGRDMDSDHGYAALNFGGQYNFTEHFSLLFTGGHSFAEDNHTLWYLGLYWTW